MARSRERLDGLCMTCLKADTCDLHPGEAARECLEYRPRAAGAPADARLPAQAKKTESDQAFRGLCADCERRVECTLSRPESGVWHCEYYC